MHRRKLAAMVAIVVVAIVAAGAWLYVREQPSQTTTTTASTKTSSSNAALAARRPDAPIPFSPSRIDAPGSSADAPRGAHKTAPPAPLPQGPVRSALMGLLQQANANPPNAEAAMTAYELLTQCRRLAKDPPAQRTPDMPDCSGLTEAEWKDAARLLKLAAEYGNERAQLTYAQRLIGLGREPGEIAPTPDERVVANQKAREYLNSLAERGNVDAMWFLGESLRLGETAPADPVMAYAYKYAVARAGAYPFTIDNELSRLESQISPQDQARARQFADQLIARCCTRR